ncbi:hypothetical protein [Variovorax paradoxus]|jgi:hypothetical protein|uniref:Uncharacterized protein n=1 Tax=Variovorax paradoxus TaxID=34073 RepID=A0A679JBL0_VARPD|nr:hypothetical protein VVAX_05012 [Variovorax paradoxus]
MATIPHRTDFPEGTEFVIKEFDVPLVRMPHGERWTWFNWFGGAPRPYSVEHLKPGNNWPAATFEAWAAVVKASLPSGAGAQA